MVKYVKEIENNKFWKNMGKENNIYECGLLRLRIRVDVYCIQSESDVVNIRYGYFFGYRVKATFTHITRVVTFEHPMNPNFNWIILNKTNKQLHFSNILSR